MVFKRGRIPWNKGTKGLMKPNKGSFKKGRVPWNKQRNIKICLTCKKPFHVSTYKIKDGRGKFCSWKCRISYKKVKALEYKLTPDMAELIGVIIGDGCISKYWNSSLYRIFISGNPIEDKDYMKNYLPKLIEKCIGKKKKPFMASNGAYLLQFSDEAFRIFLNKLGITERKTKTVCIPEKIKNEPKLLKRCIRGIADTDFTLIFTKKHNYPRIGGKFASKKLVKDLEKALRDFGFTLNVRYDYKTKDSRGFSYTSNYICLDGPHNLKRWINLIGFSNLRIISRYKLWKKKGYLQPKTTLPERLIELRAVKGVI